MVDTQKTLELEQNSGWEADYGCVGAEDVFGADWHPE